MKKILFASTALVAAGLMTASGASASEKIKLNLGGYSKWWLVGAWQDDSYTSAAATQGGRDLNSVDIKGDNEIFFGGETKLDNGMTVGVMVELEAGGDAVGNDRIDKSYAYVETAYGKVIVGSEANGTALLHVMAPDAAGNIDADGVLTGGWAVQNPGINNFVSTSIDTDAEAEKLTYVAPTFYGLTLGASYIPNAAEDNRGVSTAQEIYGVGGLYAATYGGLGVKLSGGWVTYDISSAAHKNSTEVSVGTQLSYGNFTVGGSYRGVNNAYPTNRTGAVMPANTYQGLTASNDGSAWDAGVQYAEGPWAVSLYYFASKQDGAVTNANPGEDKFTVYQVSGKYTLGAGVDMMATVGHAEYNDESTKASPADNNHNEGWAVMTGLGLTF